MRLLRKPKQTDEDPVAAEAAPPPPLYADARALLAGHYLAGEGIEIGPLHQPLAVPPPARVRYLDRMTATELRAEYPELRDWDLTEVDVVDDGERLDTVAAGSQDFIVANHFLEHCENPLGTIETHLAKLKPGGVLFYAVPDKRYTFDFRRPVTPIEHMIADYEEGPERSRAGHYDEWARLVYDDEPGAERAASPELAERHARELEAARYSIHMHVWTQAEFLGLVLACRELFGGSFDVEAATRSGIELIVVLRKDGAFPAPAAPPPSGSAPPISGHNEAGELQRWKSRARRAWQVLRNDLRRWRARP